jgi:hypothetical protein
MHACNSKQDTSAASTCAVSTHCESASSVSLFSQSAQLCSTQLSSAQFSSSPASKHVDIVAAVAARRRPPGLRRGIGSGSRGRRQTRRSVRPRLKPKRVVIHAVDAVNINAKTAAERAARARVRAMRLTMEILIVETVADETHAAAAQGIRRGGTEWRRQCRCRRRGSQHGRCRTENRSRVNQHTGRARR